VKLRVVTKEKTLDQLLNELSRKVNEVSELRKQVESIINLLNERYSSNKDSVVKPLFENFIKSNTPPQPPPVYGISRNLEKNLEEYGTKLRSYLELLTRYAKGLEECLEAEKELKRILSKIDKNKEVVRKLDENIYSNLMRLERKSQRILQNPDIPDPYALADELKKSYREIKCLLYRFDQNYKKRLTTVLELCEAAAKLYYQIKPLISLEKAEEARVRFERIRVIRSNIIKASAELANGVYLAEVSDLENQIKEIIEYFEKIMEESSSKKYARIMAVLSLISKGSKTVPLHALIDEISRSTGLSQEEILETLVYLSRRHAVKLRVKIEL